MQMINMNKTVWKLCENSMKSMKMMKNSWKFEETDRNYAKSWEIVKYRYFHNFAMNEAGKNAQKRINSMENYIYR